MWDISPFLENAYEVGQSIVQVRGMPTLPAAQQGWLQWTMPRSGGWVDPWSGQATAQPPLSYGLFQSDLRRWCQLLKGIAHSKCANTKQMNRWDLLWGVAAFHKGHGNLPATWLGPQPLEPSFLTWGVWTTKTPEGYLELCVCLRRGSLALEHIFTSGLVTSPKFKSLCLRVSVCHLVKLKEEPDTAVRTVGQTADPTLVLQAWVRGHVVVY